jgi:hypothetical protein
MTATTPSDPGYGRDQALEKTRGTGRPADADLDPHTRDVDPNPERHIHFSPEVTDEIPAGESAPNAA